MDNLGTPAEILPAAQNWPGLALLLRDVIISLHDDITRSKSNSSIKQYLDSFKESFIPSQPFST